VTAKYENTKYENTKELRQEMENYVDKGIAFAQTKDAKDVLGLGVITVSGQSIGKVSRVRFHPKTYSFEGIVCKRTKYGLKLQTCYLCEKYIERITNDAILLNIDPAHIWIGHKIVNADGKVLGRVSLVNRINDTNNIESFVCKKFIFRKMTIPMSAVKSLGASIITKSTYTQVKKNEF